MWKELIVGIIVLFVGANAVSGFHLGHEAVSLNISEEGTRAFFPLIYLNERTSPLILNITLRVSDPLDTAPSFGWINITANVTDDQTVTNVRINITSPDASTMNVSMDTFEGHNFWYNTTFTQSGMYSYFIWASDLGGNTSQSNTSAFLMPPNWDVDMDGEGNLLDLILISHHYSNAGSPGWLREDINNDGMINILDLVLESNHYDEQWLHKHKRNTTYGDPTIVSVSPSNQYVAPGEEFTVNISVTSEQPIKGVELRLAFNASLIQATAVTEGSVFEGLTTFFNPGTIDNTTGNIQRVYDLIVGPGNVTTPGTFIIISCTAGLHTGTSYLDLFNVGAANETTYLPLTMQNSSVTIGPNPEIPPTAPIITGPSSGKIGQSYSYTFNSTDPDGKNVSYYIDWGDATSEWLGPFPSGVETMINHTWTHTDQYQLLAQAKDTNNQESNWSEPFTTHITSRIFLAGFIKDIGNQTEEYVIFNMSLAIILKTNPICYKMYHQVQILLISDEFQGLLAPRLIVGRTYGLIL